MRVSRSMALIGVAGAAAAPFLAALSSDAGLVEDLTGTAIPTIWAAFSRSEQVMLLVAIGTAALAAVLRPRSRIGALVILAAAIAGAFLAWQGRVDAISAAESLSEELDAAVRDGLLAWSPGAAAGPGYLAALAGWGIAVLGGVWGIVPGASAGALPASGKAAAEARDDAKDEVVRATRYLDVVIERDDRSLGE